LPKVDISINGRLYAVACDDGQENRVRELADMVDSRVKQLTGPGPVGGVSETKAAIGGQEKPAAAAPALDAEEEDLLIAAVDHLTDRIGVIADRLGRA
jgi:cell division protein ZapA